MDLQIRQVPSAHLSCVLERNSRGLLSCLMADSLLSRLGIMKLFRETMLVITHSISEVLALLIAGARMSLGVTKYGQCGSARSW